MTVDRRAEALLRTVSARLEELADPAKAGPMAAYMKTDMPFQGVQKPGRKTIFGEVRREFAPKNVEEYRARVMALWSGPHREEKYLAIDYAQAYKAFIVPESMPLYERLIREGAWWDFVDAVAVFLVGAVLRKHSETVLPIMDRWVGDPDLWIRRSAIISQIKHKDQTDRSRLFRYCLARAHEKEFFIRKAIGWALREYSKTDPEAVETFLIRNRNSLSGLSFREGIKAIERARQPSRA